MDEDKYVKPTLDYTELTTSLTSSVDFPLAKVLKDWMDQITKDKKTDFLFELEMWINGFERFFKIQNLPLSDYERQNILSKDFSGELKLAGDVTARMSQLCIELISREKQNLLNFERYIENEFKNATFPDYFLEKILEEPSPEDSITILLDSLSDMRVVINELCRKENISYQVFTSIGHIITREIKRCKYIDLLITYKYKPHYDKIQNKKLSVIVKGIKDDGLKQSVAKAFLELFRMLNYLKYVEIALKLDRPLKNSLMIFSLIKSDLLILIDYLESKIVKNDKYSEHIRESFDGTIYAMSMELKKVFNHELVGVIYMKQPQTIYAKVENSHGLIRDSIQNSIVQIAQIFDKNFDGIEIFQNLSNRLKESLKLREDLKSLISFIKDFQKDMDKKDVTTLIERLAEFRDISLKYLMYRDWDDFERFMEEVIITSGSSSLMDVLHRFEIYLEALLGEVNKRAVLQNYKEEKSPDEGVDLLDTQG